MSEDIVERLRYLRGNVSVMEANENYVDTLLKIVDDTVAEIVSLREQLEQAHDDCIERMERSEL